MRESYRSPTAEDHERLAGVVRAFMAEAAGPDAVVDVLLKNDVDHDGDDILRVTVVLKDEVVVDGRWLVGFTRHLRSHMDEFEHFPISRFISKSDADYLNIAAA